MHWWKGVGIWWRKEDIEIRDGGNSIFVWDGWGNLGCGEEYWIDADFDVRFQSYQI